MTRDEFNLCLGLSISKVTISFIIDDIFVHRRQLTIYNQMMMARILFVDAGRSHAHATQTKDNTHR